MKNINVSYVKLNLGYKIIEYNQSFISFFGIDPENIINRSIVEVIPGIEQKPYLKLYKLCDNDQESLLIFRNHQLKGVVEPLVTILYVTIIKYPEFIEVRIANWLNWIWQLNSSLNNGYNLITNMDEAKYRKKIRRLLEMYWFKALSPLLMHIPNGFIGMINAWAFFDILKIFNNKRGKNVFSKDYNRDTISRIRCSIKRNQGLGAHVNVTEMLKDNMLINLQYNHELFIPHSILEEDIVLSADRDLLLEDILYLSIARDNLVNKQ